MNSEERKKIRGENLAGYCAVGFLLVLYCIFFESTNRGDENIFFWIIAQLIGYACVFAILPLLLMTVITLAEDLLTSKKIIIVTAIVVVIITFATAANMWSDEPIIKECFSNINY